MKFFVYIFLALVIAGTSSCAKKKTELEEKSDVEFEGNVIGQREREEARIGEGNVFEALTMDNEGLKMVENAVRTTGLDTVLAQGGPYTFFAPSDAAFDRLTDEELGYDAVPDSIGNEELRNILLHHVVKGSFMDAEIVQMEQLETMYGGPLEVSTAEGQLTVGGASIVFGDREAENGYIHIIDEVLLPN